ncbi:MAG: ABC transporter permease [Chloroflexi bacterium]|nr:ABC transporter permease [Chloroflexota bacterium]
MGRYIIRRLLWTIPVVFAISLVTFGLMHAVPGGPFDREKPLPPEIKKNLEDYYGLDQPLWKQYTDYMGGLVRLQVALPTADKPAQLDGSFLIELRIPPDPKQTMLALGFCDMGPTYRSRARTVNDVIREQFPISAQLGVVALIIALMIGVPLGIISALKQNTMLDYGSMFFAVLGVSVPSMVMGPLLIYLLSVQLHWFPAARWTHITDDPGQWFMHMILPAFTLGSGAAAIIARLTRASMLQVIREDYIRTARAKGLSERAVMIQHAMKNAFIPVATILGPMFAAVVTGSIIVEQIFAIPGLGRYFITSITNRDYPVIMGTTLLYAVLIILANLAVDMTYAWLDPRIRFD